MEKGKLSLVLLVVSCLLAFSVHAQNNGDLKIELTAQKVTRDQGGKEVLVSAETAKPGEVIQYTASYKNAGKSAVTNVKGVIPVPEGMEYLSGTAKPEKINASLDGKKYEPVPLKRKVKLPNGKETLADVPYRDYRFIQWDLKSLPAGGSAAATARMKIISAGEIPVKNK